MEKAVANLNAHETGSRELSQRGAYGNLSILDPMIALHSQKRVVDHYCCEVLFFIKT
jgi:hypothetical protein